MFELLFTALCGLVLVVLIGAVAVLLGRVGDGPRTTNPYVPAPPAAPPVQPAAGGELGLPQLAAFDRLVAGWAAEGRLSHDAADQVRALLAAHVAAALAPAASPADPAPAPVPAGAPTPALAPALSSAASPVPPGPSRLQSAGAALLALDTRRALLYLGTFLLLISSLTLVIFSWSSLAPLAQLAILAGTAAALWGGGAWMLRRPELQAAGRNLQLIAAVLMPVVGFALGRPGLLNLQPRTAWLLASALSMLVYLLAAYRTRRAFFSGAAAAAALSALLAALGELDAGWQPAPLLLLLAAILGTSWRLRRGPAPQLALGPRRVALIGAGLAGLWAAAMALSGVATDAATAGTLAAGALFCALAYAVERRRPWLWAALALPLLAAQLALAAAEAPTFWHALLFALVAPGYLLLGEIVAARHRPASAPLLAIALASGAIALLPALADAASARSALPPLILAGALAFALAEGGRLAWTGRARVPLAAGGLGAAVLLLYAWLRLLLRDALIAPELAALLPPALPSLILLPLAAVAFAAARWWPGARRRSYDLVLQASGAAIALDAGLAALASPTTEIPAALLLTLILGGQALLRRQWPWAALSLGFVPYTLGLLVERLVPAAGQLQAFTILALLTAAGYSLAAAGLRRTALRPWAWPALGWSVAAGASALALAALQLADESPVATLTLLGLAALLGLHSFIWRRPELGYGAAPLFALGVGVAASQRFFLGLPLAPTDNAYVLCALVVVLSLIGQLLRRFSRSFARPYELLAFLLLPAAPLLALGSLAHLASTWALLALLYAAALLRYRAAWMLAAACIAADLALLHGARWLLPGIDPAQQGLLLAAAVWAQGLGGALLRRRPQPWRAAGSWASLAAALGGLGALALAIGDSGHGAAVALALAALLAVLATVEADEFRAAVGVALLALGLGLLNHWLGRDLAWAAAWLALEMLGVCLAGWAATAAGLRLWRRPTTYGPIAVAAGMLPLTLLGGALPPLTFALASLGLLLVTAAVRQRSLVYAYVAGAAFVAATLCQLADWGVREPQWFVLPAGLYLLALAAGLRRFQGRRRASQLVETAAIVLLLGTTFGQALRPEGGLASSLLLFGESLAVVAYGALARLRVPFLGGAAFFVAGVTWMTVDAVRLTNQWLLLGAVGLLMVAAYVVLERHQERLVRAGRLWAAQLRSWG